VATFSLSSKSEYRNDLDVLAQGNYEKKSENRKEG